MVKQGRVYVSLPPLWCWGDNPKNFGWGNTVADIPEGAKNVTHFKGLGEMNTDQLYYFLVDKNTRNVLQIEYPSDIDEFNKILGTSEGKGSLLKDLGIILSNEVRAFENPIAEVKPVKVVEEVKTEVKKTVEKKPAKTQTKASEKTPAKKTTTKKKAVETKPVQANLFAGLFD
jgi:DNA gyrase/topoisomerase IV subunit B